MSAEEKAQLLKDAGIEAGASITPTETFPRFMADEYGIYKDVFGGPSATETIVDEYKENYPGLLNVPTEELQERFEKGLADPKLMQVSLPGQNRFMAAEGGMMSPEGGIMDLETGRQMYFLGKLVKKATKAVKKVAKSPIGKAALLAGLSFGIPGTSIGGLFGRAKFGGDAMGLFGTKGIGPLFTNLMGGKINPLNPVNEVALTGKQNIFQKALGLVKDNPLEAIAATSVVAGLLTPEQEDQAQLLADNTGIDIEAARNQILNAAAGKDDFRARAFRADGGRIGAQEGGIMPRLNQLSGSVSSAEQMLQQINQRLESAESSLGSGGGDMQQPFMGRPDFEAMIDPSAKPQQLLQVSQRPSNLAFLGRPVDMGNQPVAQLPSSGSMGSGIPAASYAKGGDVEPVAKKTMPLLDMGGKEMDLRAEGGFVPIGRMEKADDVPARLSKNEFVFTADAVRNAGDGDVDKGAEVMYNMMKNLESGGDVSEESQGLEGARRMFQTSQRLEEVL
jgi:hypothetical protein